MMRTYAKPSLTLQQQIEHLLRKGMAIADKQLAEAWLQHVSYYRMSAYWHYFLDNEQEAGLKFRAGTSLENVIALYDFDRLLRRLVMRGTEHVEVALRGSWAYQMGQLGDGHSYINASRYSKREEFYKDLAKLTQQVGGSRETYIKHYRDSYDEPVIPPVWMVAEMMSFGQISRWYSNLRDRNLRNIVAEPLGLPEVVLVPLIRHIADIRNICAHHGRLWNRRFLIRPKLAEKPDYLYQSLYKSADKDPAKLYNGLTMIAHIVCTVAPESTWKIDLAHHIKSNPNVDIAAMGFPNDWHDRPLWK